MPRKNFFNPTSLDSRFKAQKKLLQSHPLGFKIQYSRLKAFGFKKSFWDLESWILTPSSLDSRSFFWALNLESWILPPWIQEVFFSEPWILNLVSYPLGFKKSFLGSWILNPTPLDWRSFFFSEPWILNLEPYPLGFKKFFLSLESWILNPQRLD